MHTRHVLMFLFNFNQNIFFDLREQFESSGSNTEKKELRKFCVYSRNYPRNLNVNSIHSSKHATNIILLPVCMYT